MTAITSRQHPVVRRCRELARDRRGDATEILLDGAHLVGEALDAGVPMSVALLGDGFLDRPEGAALAARLGQSGATIYRASDAAMDAASPVRTSTGVVAIGRLAPHPADALWTPAPALVVCLAGLQDPGNVGAVLRAAEAAGATGAILTAGSADPFGWKALRGSMGSALRLPLTRFQTVGSACDEAAARGVAVAALTPAGGDDLYAADLRGPLLLLVGGEGPGLPADALDAADLRIRIPMEPPVESLNAAVAAGVVLFEARRQRRGGVPA